jgi:polysaccharide biosynthesis/export protein
MPRLRWAVIPLLVTIGFIAGCAPKPRGAELAIAMVDTPYLLGSGDKLRITVLNQANLSATYQVDPSGLITMPLLGPVEASGRSPFELKGAIEARLRKDYLREPNVSVEIESYRPFFILGEVTAAGQYPFVAGMTAEQAVAIAGGYSPRAYRKQVELSRRDQTGVTSMTVPMTTLIRPGDTVTVKERWF